MMKSAWTVLPLLLFALYCGAKFTVKDRFEGEKDGVVRIYVRVTNDADYDENDTTLNKKIHEQAARRLALLTESGIVKKSMEDKADTRIVHVRCFDEYCEGFVDFKTIRKGKQ
jgi:predicted Mrr-cat superfamily restriction endonuclease